MLVKLKLDNNNLVTAIAWANPNHRKAGDIANDGFTIYEVDETEYSDCIVDHTKLIDGHLVLDADYVAPVIDTTSMPTEQDLINAQLLQQAAAQQMTNAAIVKQIATIEGVK